MSGTDGEINTWAWRKLRDQVVAEEPDCRLKIPGVCTGRSTTADHVIPRRVRPDLTMRRENLHGACQPCNLARGDTPVERLPALRAKYAARSRTGAGADPGRIVVCLFGPTGAGKTTAARANPYGLAVYDRDDPQWASDKAFTRALDELGTTPGARAVVIRHGATRGARAKTRGQVGATRAWLMTVPPSVAKARVIARARADARYGAVWTDAWWTRHEADNARHGPVTDVEPWPGGWPANLSAEATKTSMAPASRPALAIFG